MFQTKFDRWLKENFVYEHHIRVVHLPTKLPSGVKVSELQSNQYHYLLTVKNKTKAEKLIEQLKAEGNAFKTKIAEGSHWYNPLINNKHKSFSFRIFWWVVIASLTIYLFVRIRAFLQSDFYFELKSHIQEVLGA
ncbi:hypothetical protein [Rubritalea tangerina]|uniref:Uncharacterized protein n=1 Tax=Rubritalea tangerina TaxID=430798 RepID=A0ABW4Z639_9BACT